MPGPKYVKDFSFPSDFGFSGSAGQVSVRPHGRQAPRRFAEGGAVKKDPPPDPKMKAPPTPPPPEKRASLIDIIRGKTRREREAELGLRKGGKVKRAMGGPVKAAKGGDIAQDKRMIKTALNQHIRAPKPKGHGVK